MYKLVVLCLVLLTISNTRLYGQQDVQFHLNKHILTGKNILKVKRDLYDPYLWVLAQGNEIFRINSLTMAIDDYTATFAPYASLQFIDIAGRSADTVFIATNSTNVIHYKEGTISLIGAANGIPGVVNSVGIAGGITNNPFKTAAVVMIATNSGFFFYNSDTGVLTNKEYNTQDVASYSKVYQANYRTQMYRDSSLGTEDDFTPIDTVKYQPIAFLPNNIGVYGGWLWEGGNEFGYNINTADVVYQTIDSYNPDFSNLFWGNDRGLFQSMWYYSSSPGFEPYGHYLNGIKVNKIDNIYGLTAFGLQLTKQNMLIGTDRGLYFSSSAYQQNDFALKTFSLFHDDELGNIVINDICVNAASINTPICEDGVWLGAADGLYLLKPDYATYLNTQTLKAINFKNHPDTLLNVCEGDSAIAVVNTQQYTGHIIQWYKNSIELAGQSGDTLTINGAGDYYAVLYDPCEAIHLSSNHLKVNITNGPTFSFNYPDQIQYCNNSPYTLVVTNNPGYHYRWYTNNVLNGDTTSAYIVTATGKYHVEVSACTNSWVPSKEVEIDLIGLPAPQITADKYVYCAGDYATLTVNTPVDNGYTINWYKDDILIPQNTNSSSINTNIAGNYNVSITYNTPNTDGTICSQISVVQRLKFDTPPTLSIKEIINTTICDGQTVTLSATYSGGKIKWSTGETTDQISVKQAGNYSASVMSVAGCSIDSIIAVSFLPNPIFSMPDTSICVYKRQAIMLTAPPGYLQYVWDGIPGTQTYQVSQPQTVNLTVTDGNGCLATKSIKVIEKCPEIFIPNAFTPNNDGKNDTWVIDGLDNDPTVLVEVFNRYGQQVFQSKGYGTPWNGETGSKKLPAGVYYYIVAAKNETQKFSGSLTIIY